MNKRMTMTLSPSPLDFSDVCAALGRGDRVALFIRHSERPPIRPDDKDFGRHLGLTPRGVALAREAGARLTGAPPDARFLASPMQRCRLTARHVAEGMGISAPRVEDADPLGVRGFFYRDPYAVQEIMRQQGYMAYMLEYLKTGNAPHSAPLADATEQTLEWMITQMTVPFVLFVSHDIFVAAILTGLRLRSYTAEAWVGFLHGFALVRHGQDPWACHPCLPSHAAVGAPHPFIH